MQSRTEARALGTALRGLLLAVIAAVALGLWFFWQPLLGDNFHVLIPGEAYRSAQLSAPDLERAIERLELRSVVNLRGAMEGMSWYENERRVTETRGVALYSIRLSADRLPSRGELTGLMEILKRAERPLLLHCRGGTDRSGLASAVLLLLEGRDLDSAWAEFAPRHGYLMPFKRFGLHRYLDQYAVWLEERGAEHSPDRVRGYTQLEFAPGIYGASLEAVDLPTTMVAGAPHTAAIRVVNTSTKSWQLTESWRPRGVHLGLWIWHLEGEPSAPPCEARGETPEGRLGPGESAEFWVDLPTIPRPGRYQLSFDMVDESEAWFADRGASTPLVAEVEVVAASNGVPERGPRGRRHPPCN
jgi:protein tyrosine phosphatase (PTP) superfamily phosphohydrolase (DUF442 family)